MFPSKLVSSTILTLSFLLFPAVCFAQVECSISADVAEILVSEVESHPTEDRNSFSASAVEVLAEAVCDDDDVACSSVLTWGSGSHKNKKKAISTAKANAKAKVNGEPGVTCADTNGECKKDGKTGVCTLNSVMHHRNKKPIASAFGKKVTWNKKTKEYDVEYPYACFYKCVTGSK